MILNFRLFTHFYKYKRKALNYSYKTIKRNFTENGEKGLNILFFGTDNFSLPSLKALHKNSCSKIINKLEVVTSYKSPANCVRKFAEEHETASHRWPVSTEICREHDLGIVVSFGHLIPERIINSFPLGMINVHASLLPRWRGAAPIIYAIMHGDTRTGVSIMKIEPKHFDIGDILAQREVFIENNVLMPQLHAELANVGADLLIEVLSDFKNKLANARTQNNAYATFVDCVVDQDALL